MSTNPCLNWGICSDSVYLGSFKQWSGKQEEMKMAK